MTSLDLLLKVPVVLIAKLEVLQKTGIWYLPSLLAAGLRCSVTLNSPSLLTEILALATTEPIFIYLHLLL